MSSNAITQGEGLYVYIDNRWTEIKQLVTSPELSQTPNRIETTHSKSEMQTYTEGIPAPPQDMTWGFNAMPAGVTDSNIDLVRSLVDGTEYYFRKTMPTIGMQVSFWGTARHSFSGRTGVNQLYTLNLTITPSTRFTVGEMTESLRVIYNANGGTGSVSDGTTYQAGDTVTMKPGTALTKTGHVFAGWNSAADGSGATYEAGENIVIYDNMTLYALWLGVSA